jgi:hypothetical protein
MLFPQPEKLAVGFFSSDILLTVLMGRTICSVMLNLSQIETAHHTASCAGSLA